MADPKRRKGLAGAAIVAGALVAGPVATVLIGLGSITSWAAFMDVHGFTAFMRLAVVAAVAVVVIPLGWWVAATLLDRIEAKKDKAQLEALRYGAHSATPRGNR